MYFRMDAVFNNVLSRFKTIIKLRGSCRAKSQNRLQTRSLTNKCLLNLRCRIRKESGSQLADLLITVQRRWEKNAFLI